VTASATSRDDLRDLAHEIVLELAPLLRELGRKPTWLRTRDLAKYSGLGISTIEKRAAARDIGGLAQPGVNVFNVERFDAWLWDTYGVKPRGDGLDE
jgi:hypothetical protein